MHPRNIYNNRLDFKKLAEEFPEFKQNTTLDLKGRVRLDFKNPEALRGLSKTLLRRDFNLDVHFPPNALVPTIPLRLNYILYIEDVLNLANRHENIRGLDIGTGASCVYPLLAARKNAWEMVGTEINPESIEFAKQNISKNNLKHLIKVVHVSQAAVLDEVLSQDSVRYDFCMCNPPFFGDVNELCSQLKGKPNRPSPKNAFIAEPHEVLTEGGEVEFVGKIIDESCKFLDRIRIYSSMLGIKRSIKPLITKLRQLSNIKSMTTTEFHQGHTTRFCIAWTFDNTINLENLNQTEKNKPKIKPFIYNVQKFNGNIDEVDVELKKMFNELQFKYSTSKKTNAFLYNIIAYDNTWSHNRRKRRELARISSQITATSASEDKSEENACGELQKIAFNVQNDQTTHVDLSKCSSLKRKAEDTNESNQKKVKIDDKKQKEFLKGTILVEVQDSELTIELIYEDGPGGKDAAHQVLQYIKNHLKL